MSQFLTWSCQRGVAVPGRFGLSIILGVNRIVTLRMARSICWAPMSLHADRAPRRRARLLGRHRCCRPGVAVIGVLVEMLLLRRIYHAPELFQLLADLRSHADGRGLVVLIWGPDDLVGRRAPGFKGNRFLRTKHSGAIDLFLIALGPVVLVSSGCCSSALAGASWCARRRRTATWSQRSASSKMAVHQCVRGGVFLAALGGALRSRVMRCITRWICASSSRSLSWS